MGAYRTVNLVLLGLLLFAPVFILISPAMERAFPSVWRCHWKAASGQECPFCGLTRGAGEFMETGDIPPEGNPRLRPLVTGYAIVLPARAVFTWLSFRRMGRALPWIDGAVHLVLPGLLFSL
ncbi:MAG TPA: hypothetical protein PLM22_02445 [Candidatus Sabulitectum sp.]|nr:hypothetical protein [Candidatus Sabulitectum sp.]